MVFSNLRIFAKNGTQNAYGPIACATLALRNRNMRIRHGRRDGSVLIVMIVVTAIVGITLGSYLNLVANQNLSVLRSMAWNSAISVAEAGVEEAMAHVNRNGTNRVLDGWAADGTMIQTPLPGTNIMVNAVYVTRERTIGSSKYKVYISKDIDPPVIYAEGHVLNPKGNDYLPRPRVVKATTVTDFLFTKGMVAKGEIDLSGNNIRSDSFDSTDPNYSTGGKYDSTKAKANGDVATNSSLIDSLDVWNAEVFGHVSTGPGGNVKIGSNGSVGDTAWHAAGKKGLQPGYFSDDMNVSFPDVEAPFTGGGFTPTTGTVSGTNYSYVLGTGNWQMTGLSLNTSGAMLVNGTAVLYVTGDVSLGGQAYIYIAPGASLQMYVAGANTSLGGKGVVNDNATAAAFGYWGLPSNTSISFGGNAAFTGTIYAPQAVLTLGGGGSTVYDFVGACMTSSVKMNGHFKFHYDEALKSFGPRRGYIEALKSFGPRRGYIVSSWNEASYEEVHSVAGGLTGGGTGGLTGGLTGGTSGLGL
jgi:hypothetical protein